MTTLSRAIGLPQATAIVVGIILGASVFVQASEITAQVPSLMGVTLVWLVAGLLTMGGALVCAELSSALPRTGGVYVFLSEIYSPRARVPLGLGDVLEHAHGHRGGHRHGVRPLCGLLRADGRRRARGRGRRRHPRALGRQLRSACGSAAACRRRSPSVKVVAVAASSSPSGRSSIQRTLRLRPASMPSGRTAPATSCWRSAPASSPSAAGTWSPTRRRRRRDPERTIPRVAGPGHADRHRVLRRPEPRLSVGAADRSRDRLDARRRRHVRRAGRPDRRQLVSALVMFSAFGALNGVILAGPRVYYSMAQDGLLFKWVADVHPTYRTPGRAIVLQAVWAVVLVVTGTYRDLFTRVIYTEWIFFGAARDRRRPAPPSRRATRRSGGCRACRSCRSPLPSLLRHRAQPDSRRSAQQRDRPADGAGRAAGVSGSGRGPRLRRVVSRQP